MIDHYNIKYENKEQVLYIYLNYNYEFASFNKNKSFFTELKKLITNKYLNFRYVQKVILNDFLGYDNYTINTDNIENNIKIDNTNNKPKIENTNNNEIINNTNTLEIINDTNTNTKEIINDTITNDNTNIISETNIIENTITIYRSNGEIINIELEDYLIGVVAGEMPASFNIEALKVQAIIARTYTLKSIKRNKILTDTVDTQVYIDINQMHDKWGSDFNKYYNKIKEAVTSTKDLVITYNNDYIDAVYFANSNGYTEDAKEVWGYNIPYLKSVECKYDINSTNYLRTKTISYEELSNKLNMPIDNTVEIYNILRNNSHRIISISINDKTYTGIEIRNILNLRSADFDISITDEGLEFTTYGYGHGVGISQYGANGMANNGYNYESIIKYFYQSVTIEKNT